MANSYNLKFRKEYYKLRLMSFFNTSNLYIYTVGPKLGVLIDLSGDCLTFYH